MRFTGREAWKINKYNTSKIKKNLLKDFDIKYFAIKSTSYEILFLAYSEIFQSTEIAFQLD